MPTETQRYEHPIKRIRKELKKLPATSILHHYSGAQQFARWIGCSESLIRNVETGAVAFSEKLALLIRKKTEVSDAWLLSHPRTDEPILDRKGNEWCPENLDVFVKYPNLDQLYKLCPSLLPRIIAKLVEAHIKLNFAEEKPDYSVSILQRLYRSGLLNNPRFHHFLKRAIEEDEAFRGKFKDCLYLALDDSADYSPDRERTLYFLKEMEPKHSSGKQFDKLTNKRSKSRGADLNDEDW